MAQAHIQIDQLGIAHILDQHSHMAIRIGVPLQLAAQVVHIVVHNSDLVAVYGYDLVASLETVSMRRAIGNDGGQYDAA